MKSEATRRLAGEPSPRREASRACRVARTAAHILEGLRQGTGGESGFGICGGAGTFGNGEVRETANVAMSDVERTLVKLELRWSNEYGAR